MMIPGGANIVKSAAAPVVASVATRTFPAAAPSVAVQPQREDLTRRFDSVTITGESGQFLQEKDLKSKLAQEVRMATPTDRISALREQIQSGAYRPDPTEIARKMLLWEEAI